MVFFTECYLGDKVKEDEMNKACSTRGKEKKYISSFR